jgi:ubiquinone biosynthesis monooxygenase Coq7
MDSFLSKVDAALRSLVSPEMRMSQRAVPGEDLPEADLSPDEKKHIAALIRVNHAGEICAQALYQGQALTAQLIKTKNHMAQAAAEENDHLAWCEQRLRELDGKVSLLNPIWYMGSLAIGALAGLAGDKISLGFVDETEQQVSAHLQKHLDKIPTQDEKTKMLLEQMQKDEIQHAEQARSAGAVELPIFIKSVMHWVSNIMTKTSYYL